MPITGILETIFSMISSVIPEEIMGYGLQLSNLLPVLLFIVFVYLAYKSLKIAFRGAIVFTAASLFPLFANYFFGASIAIGLDSMLSYGASGLILYIAYVFLGTIIKILKIITWPLRKLFGRDEDLNRDEVEEMIEEEK